MKQQQIILGTTPSQMNGPYWRKSTDNVTDEILKLPPSKVISYFKVIRRTHGGSKTEIQFWKTLKNGYMVFVDETNCKVGVVLGIGIDRGLQFSTKKEFDKALDKVMQAIFNS